MRNQSDNPSPQLRAHRLAQLVLFPAVLLSAPWAAQAACTGACPPSTVGLTVNPAGQAYRQQSVALTAQVARGNAAAPGGSVDFIDNGQVIATVPLGNAGTASTSVAYQATGSHSLAARYSGDTANGPGETASAASLTVVQKLAPRIQAIPSPMSAQACQPVTITASLTGGANPTGTVTFKDNGAAIAPAIKLVDGKASLTTSFAAAGSHQISASYSGDTAHQSSNGSATPVTVVAGQQTLWFNTSGEVPFACAGDSNASLQLADPLQPNRPDPRIVNLAEATGVRNADGGLGYGKVPDPLNQGDGPWLQHRVISTDGNSHGTASKPVMRSEESTHKMLDLGDEVWIVFEWFTPTEGGLGQLKARSKEDVDEATLLQLHAPTGDAYSGTLPYVALTVSSSPAFPNGYRTVDIARHEWDGANKKFKAWHQANWLPGGRAGKYFGTSYTGYSDPNWPQGSVGVKEAWAFHIKLHYATGQFYTRAWMATRGGPVQKIADDTTTANVPDISKSGGSPIGIANIKNGIYAFNHPLAPAPFDWRTMKRRFQVLRNQHAQFTASGLTEEQVAAKLIREAQSP